MQSQGYFDELGRAMSEIWSGMGRQMSSLPDASVQALKLVEPPAGLGAVDILTDAVKNEDLPRQSNPADSFGQPPLIMYDEGDFFVQALTWMDGSTAVHEHGFAGAFMVLQGASLHIEHHFDEAERMADDFILVGDLSQARPEVLRPGDVRPIEVGGDFIHALFHLEKPTVTMVIRNESCRLQRPQYAYRAPGLAWPGWVDRIWLKRMQGLDTTLRLDPDAGLATLREMMDQAPLREAFSLLEHWCQTHPWDEVTDDLANRLGARSSALETVLAPALQWEQSVHRILFRRGMLKEMHQRVLLALLANLPDPDAITRIITNFFPGQEPADLLIDWAEELSAPALRGVSGLQMTPARAAELRADQSQGRERLVLDDILSAWGEPQKLALLFADA